MISCRCWGWTMAGILWNSTKWLVNLIICHVKLLTFVSCSVDCPTAYNLGIDRRCSYLCCFLLLVSIVFWAVLVRMSTWYWQHFRFVDANVQEAFLTYLCDATVGVRLVGGRNFALGPSKSRSSKSCCIRRQWTPKLSDWSSWLEFAIVSLDLIQSTMFAWSRLTSSLLLRLIMPRLLTLNSWLSTLRVLLLACLAIGLAYSSESKLTIAWRSK